VSDETRLAGRVSTGRTGQAAPVAPEMPRLRPLEVSVRHGSLEHAPYRLLIGHYQGLPLSGAEAQLNRRSDGRLERLLLTHQYPQRLGEIAILEPVDEAPPQGAIILGLGPTGELAPIQLRDIVTRALLRVALNELDRRLVRPAPSGGWPPLGMCSVLVGSGLGSSVSVESSVRALVDATLSANGRLTRLRIDGGGRLATDLVAIEALELIERYEDRVDLIVGVLARMSSMEGGGGVGNESVRQPVEYSLIPKRGEGRSSARSPIDAANGVWRRLDIRVRKPNASADTIELEFTSIGRLARAERLVGLAERAILEPLLTNAIENEADPDISGTLYELLVPQELKGELGSGEHLHLLVDKHTADYPWELMRPRPDEQEQDRPLALRVGVLRQFRQTEGVRFDVHRATGHNALVIGNPPSPPNAQLPGAMKESLAAARQLRAAEWHVSTLIWDTAGNPVTPETPTASPSGDAVGGTVPLPQVSPIRALHLLLNGDWRVVHIAAHGQLSGDAATTGVVLGDLRLTANVFSKMSVVPDLVVMNACHLGRILTGANRVAASVGQALLQLGVRAVVVAGWAVNDVAAEAFSEALYTALLSGADFGRAVSFARDAAWRVRPMSLTWGAYQCYGDPGFSLTTKSPARTRADVYTEGELRRRIQRLQSAASDQGRSSMSDAGGSDALRRELCELGKDARRLGSPPAALADLADAWAELLELRSAIARYRTAVARGGSNVTIRSIEQLGNLLSRRAQQLHRRGLERASKGDSQRAERWLARTLELGPTGERLALMAGFHKRQATMTTGRVRDKHLAEAVRLFVEAQRLQPKAYHEQNAIQLAEVARLHGLDVAGPDGSGATAPAQAPKGAERRRAETAPDFWTRAGLGDRLLTDMIVAGGSGGAETDEIDRASAAIVDAYRAAFRLRSSARERDSVVGHLRDLDELVPEGTPLATSLAKIRADLEAWSEHDAGDGQGTGR
jgi:hypothetical protein